MKRKEKEIFDTLGREGKNKIVHAIIIGLFSTAFVALYSLYCYDPYTPTGLTFQGKIIGVFKPDSEFGVTNVRLSAKLDNGSIVVITGPRIGPIRIKKHVLIKETKSKYFKRTRYVFMRYLEQ
jgi:hypothetical protein